MGLYPVNIACENSINFLSCAVLSVLIADSVTGSGMSKLYWYGIRSRGIFWNLGTTSSFSSSVGFSVKLSTSLVEAVSGLSSCSSSRRSHLRVSGRNWTSCSLGLEFSFLSFPSPELVAVRMVLTGCCSLPVLLIEGFGFGWIDFPERSTVPPRTVWVLILASPCILNWIEL